MWSVFKLINLFWLLASTYFWVTALLPLGPLLVFVNAVMLISLGMLQLDIRLNRQVGMAAAFILATMLWFVYVDGAAMGTITLLMYLPMLYLIVLPDDYKADLLRFTTKWYAILLIPALLEYWVTLIIDIPSIGMYNHPNYVPYINYGFFIKTTWDSGMLVRFNAFFLEPGHLALLSTFMMMANRFRLKECKWLWVLLLSVIFSFSLAGYLLAVLSFVMLKMKSVNQIVIVGLLMVAFVIAVQNFSGGENAINDMIISRLELDESTGIKGNNRFSGNTDFEFDRSLKSGDVWFGIKDKTNMDLIAGAGYKIFIIGYGLIGTILALGIYLSCIPSHPDSRYTLSFLTILILCFLQRAYPAWYSWLFPYITGIYLASRDRSNRDIEYSQSSDVSNYNEA